MNFLKYIIILMTFYLNLCNTYRILGIFPFNGKSHNVIFDALMLGLANKGHKVDVISHYNIKNSTENLNLIINLDGSMEKTQNNYTLNDAIYFKTHKGIIFDLYGNRLCHLMGLKEMQDFIRNPPNDPPYDLVITEVKNDIFYFHNISLCYPDMIFF